MQYIIRYDIRSSESEAFRSWLIENDDAIRASARPGWTYLGTWFTVQGFGSYQNETRWEIGDYGDLGAAWSDEGARLTHRWMGFVDDGRPIETSLVKAASDVVILEGS